MAPKAKPAPNDVAVEPPAKKVRVMHGREEAKAATTMTREEFVALQEGMKEKWPKPPYMKGSTNSHTNYRDETYSLVTRWMAETKISYRPHAKAPGSKSHLRYEKYSQAKTVAEALELGSWPADWCWDYEKGFIHVEGPVREEPLNLAQVIDDSSITKVDWVLNRWYRREIAKELGLDHKELGVNKGSGESTLMRAHRLVAQREAKKIMESAAKEKRRITDEEVTRTLSAWSFAKNPNRTNVLPDGHDWVFSDTLGLIRDRLGDIHLTAPTTMYPDVTRVLTRWLRDRLPPKYESFTFTSLNLNCNYAARLHRDGNNFGPSFISAFGDFEGGELCYWPEDDRGVKLENMEKMDIKKHRVTLPLRENGQSNVALFNGNSGHSVEPFTGTRFSVVYFTVGCHASAVQQDKDALHDLGVKFTPEGEDQYRLVRQPRGLTASGTPGPKGVSTLTHEIMKPKDWEKRKYQTPTPQKLTGEAEKLRKLMEEGRGISALHSDKARQSSGRLKGPKALKRPASAAKGNGEDSDDE